MKKSNDPFYMSDQHLPIRRHDNTLVMIDNFIAETANDVTGDTISMGEGENGTLLIAIHRTADGSAKAYSIPMLVLAGLFTHAHDTMKSIPHVRPITEADAELEAIPDEDEMNREPTAEELAAFEATVPPSINEA